MSGPNAASQRRSRFWPVLLSIALAALAVRVAYVAFDKHDEPMIGDQFYYHVAANRLSNGDGFVEIFNPNPPPLLGTAPAADHPPLTVIALAPVSAITDESAIAHRLATALLGVVVVLLLGVLARELVGDVAGWIAAGIGAFYPNLWVNDGLVMSETFAALIVTAALLLGYRLLHRPRMRTAVALGALCGVAALTRAELLLLVPLLAVPAALVSRGAARNVRWRMAGASSGAAIMLIAPWAIYNLIRFEEPTFISTNDGIALLGSNCDSVYYGRDIGLTDLQCVSPDSPGDQSVDSRIYRDQAIDFVEAHAEWFAVVAAARVGRTWSLYRPTDMLDYNKGEAREPWITALGLVAYYPILFFGVAGAIVLWRRRVELWPLLAPAVIVTLASALTYGQTRFRVPVEPSLVTLAAVAVAALATRSWPPPREYADTEMSAPSSAGEAGVKLVAPPVAQPNPSAAPRPSSGDSAPGSS